MADEITLANVREYNEGFAVEIGRASNGRIAVIAYNECQNNLTMVDLFDLIECLKFGPKEDRIDEGFVVRRGSS